MDNETSLLLGLLPSPLLSPEQVARWPEGEETATYKLLREPVTINDFDLHERDKMAIWRDNGTLTYVANRFTYDWEEDDRRALYVEFPSADLIFMITGNSDMAIAETAAFWGGMKETNDTGSFLDIKNHDEDGFHLSVMQPESFTKMLEANLGRRVRFINVTLSAEQSVIMATRPRTLELEFWECSFEDEGTALVDALQHRQSTLGSLKIVNSMPLTDANLRRLLRVNTIGHLGLHRVTRELALLPFAAPVDSLEYFIYSTFLMEEDLVSLDIATKNLSLEIWNKSVTFPTELLLSLFQRLAALGHFVKLEFGVYQVQGMVVPECVVEGLIRAIMANKNLEHLDLSKGSGELDLNPHLKTLLEALQNHKGLRTLKIKASVDAFGPGFSYLRQLLSENRDITVLDEKDAVFSDGLVVDQLYAFNKFYCDSGGCLLGEPQSVRPLLVATTLVRSVSGDFRRSAFLLAHHTDSLIELVQFAQFEPTEGEFFPSEPIQANSPHVE